MKSNVHMKIDDKNVHWKSEFCFFVILNVIFLVKYRVPEAVLTILSMKGLDHTQNELDNIWVGDFNKDAGFCIYPTSPSEAAFNTRRDFKRWTARWHSEFFLQRKDKEAFPNLMYP